MAKITSMTAAPVPNSTMSAPGTTPNTDPMDNGPATVPSLNPTQPAANVIPGAPNGIIAGAQAPVTGASTYAPSTLGTAAQLNVTGDQTAQGQMQKMADQNNPYFQTWATAGAQNAAARGFTGNSSIQQSGILDSVMRNAEPIAVHDADAYGHAAAYNADTANQFSRANMEAANTAGQFNAGNQNQLNLANLNANTQLHGIDTSAATQRYATDTGAATQRYSTDVGANTQLHGIDTNAASQRYATDTGAATQLHGIDVGAATQLHGIDTNAATQLGTANISAGTQRYGIDQNAATQLATANLSAGTQRYMSDQSAQTQLALSKMSTSSQQLVSQAHDANAVLLANSSAAQQAYNTYASSVANIDEQTSMDANAKANAIDTLSQAYQSQIQAIKTSSPGAAAAYSPLYDAPGQQPGAVITPGRGYVPATTTPSPPIQRATPGMPASFQGILNNMRTDMGPVDVRNQMDFSNYDNAGVG